MDGMPAGLGMPARVVAPVAGRWPLPAREHGAFTPAAPGADAARLAGSALFAARGLPTLDTAVGALPTGLASGGAAAPRRVVPGFLAGIGRACTGEAATGEKAHRLRGVA